VALTLIHEAKEVLLGWTEGFHASVRRVGIKVEWPVESEFDTNRTASTNTIIMDETVWGLASLLGKYDDDPSWDEFPAFLEQYRRQIDEMNK
jgi:hypothetical protein